MSEVEGGFITADALHWQGKFYKAQPEPRAGNRCGGCAFRADGTCRRPTELAAYTCIDAFRSDYRGIVWVKED